MWGAQAHVAGMRILRRIVPRRDVDSIGGKCCRTTQAPTAMPIPSRRLWPNCRAGWYYGQGLAVRCHKRPRSADLRHQAGGAHGHFQRDFQLVGRQYVVHPPLHGVPWQARRQGCQGNRYYVQNKGVGPLGVPRRWVIYTNFAEASKIPAEWHGWMHYTVDTPPTEQKYAARPWQRPHWMNLDGHTGGLPSAGLHSRQGRASKSDGRLQAPGDRSRRVAVGPSQRRPNSRPREFECAGKAEGRMRESCSCNRSAMTDSSRTMARWRAVGIGVLAYRSLDPASRRRSHRERHSRVLRPRQGDGAHLQVRDAARPPRSSAR